MCACVRVCQRQGGRERECWTEMEGGVSRDRERKGKWSGLNHESNRERERERETALMGQLQHPVYLYFML